MAKRDLPGMVSVYREFGLSVLDVPGSCLAQVNQMALEIIGLRKKLADVRRAKRKKAAATKGCPT